MRSGHAVRSVGQRHGGAVRIGYHRLGRVMRQSGGRGVDTNIVALGEWRHPHVGGPAKRLLVRVQRLRKLRPRQLPSYHHGRLVRILEDNGRASLASDRASYIIYVNVRAGAHARVHARIVSARVRIWIGEQRHVVRILRRRKGMAGAGATVWRWKRDRRGRRLNTALEGTAAPLRRLLVVSLLDDVGGAATGHVVHAGRSPLTASIAPVTGVTVHAARGRFAMAAGVTVPRASSAVATRHGVQRRRIGGIRARSQFLVRHSWISSAQASWRVSSVCLKLIRDICIYVYSFDSIETNLVYIFLWLLLFLLFVYYSLFEN